MIEFICKTNPWRYRIKHLKGVKVLVVVESLLSKRWTSYYLEPHSHTADKIKVN